SLQRCQRLEGDVKSQREHQVAARDFSTMGHQLVRHAEAIGPRDEQDALTPPAYRAVQVGDCLALEAVLETGAAHHRRQPRSPREPQCVPEVIASVPEQEVQVDAAEPDRVDLAIQLANHALGCGQVAVDTDPADGDGLAQQVESLFGIARGRSQRYAYYLRHAAVYALSRQQEGGGGAPLEPAPGYSGPPIRNGSSLAHASSLAY